MRTLALALLLPLLSPVPVFSQEEIELVESVPVETTLDHPDLRDAWQVWPEMIGRASRTLDISQFYISNEPASRLETVLAAVEKAAGRGVRVRVLSDKRFEKTYPESLARLREKKGIEVRIIDYGPLTDGVLHAKYFVVDGREVFLGSQNFDWRSLEHIQELGVRIVEPAVARAFLDVFETDWGIVGHSKDFRARAPANGYGFPAVIGGSGEGPAAPRVTAVFSPTGWLPDETLWDLPRLVEMIDGAKTRVRVQLHSYKTKSYGDTYFDTLESALRRAAGRGVQVQLLMGHWATGAGSIEGLQSLQALPGIDVRILTVPAASSGFIPFGRVAHAKYMAVDGRLAWVGTSNWEGNYFRGSRNVGVVIESGALAARIDKFFDDNWGSPYSRDVDPCAKYPAPRIAE